MVGLLIFLGVSCAIAARSAVGGQAYRAGNWPMAAVAITVAAAACIGVVFLSFSAAGRQLPDRIANRLLRDEGEAVLACPTSPGRLRIARMMAVAFGLCILFQVFFGDAIPVRYRQPVSALYAVPFLVGVWCLQRPATGHLSLLWPALFGLHAVLLLLGAPILFTGPLEFLNLVLPVVGYGILTHLMNHLYARLALHKVKQLAGGDGAMQ